MKIGMPRLGRWPVPWVLVSLAVGLWSGCSPEPFSPPLGENERLLLEKGGEQPLEALPAPIEDAAGRALGTLEAGEARKGWTLFFRAPDGDETLLWGVDTVGELYLVSQTADGALVRLYWYTPGLLSSNAMVTQLRTATGEAVSRRAAKDAWSEAVKTLRARTGSGDFGG